ncbi:MAG: ATP-dependent zinc protease [Porticoccaceae bacterium]|nr:ATP-dependent zinc protease [Pseudomonadales bacterium]MCP5170940.1 ATP-dependent zinc protease [Pseudomonadales bacterium]MCP5301820.1 ATP-dependent zinc protease [Pseudomonadales bacterium]
MWQHVVIVSLVALLWGCAVVEPQPQPQSQPEKQPEIETVVHPIAEVESCPPVPVCEVCSTTIVCPKLPVRPIVKPPPKAMKSGDLPVVGAVEMVTLVEHNLKFRARIDTGAESSSIHASDIVLFEREGNRWVRFSVQGEKDSQPFVLERPLVRKVAIKQHEGMRERRYVVEMRLRMGDINERVEVTLADRSDLKYPVLIGRNFLTDTAVVDVSRRYILKGNIPATAPAEVATQEQ